MPNELWDELPRPLREFFCLYAKGEYFDAHEVLEDFWLEEGRDPLLQALIQVAVAYYHYEAGNVAGSRALFTSALGYLERAEESRRRLRPLPSETPTTAPDDARAPHPYGLRIPDIVRAISELLPHLPDVRRLPLEEVQKAPLPKVEFSPGGVPCASFCTS
ncbi:DUF309 domain-containing protein [Brockia lithotrophica]|uniref:DUF309 domain-containing protein n=1 Tax=Brockia lithotrophica TaxID=933949 RepID=A0A660L481_9BACL|nr:DUF309 domain-containing protein [Brockia lithotrophica]RKQ88716.1 hypothetical protein C7438_0357 [Brockia lithotrophica]